jgi:glycosyltransferase involved in cell wall biosynthesis
MRVVMLSHGFLPRVGGIESLLGVLTPELRRKSLDMHVITRRLIGTKPYEEVNGVPVYRMPVRGPKPIASLMFTITALKKIRELSPDLIHAHEFISPATVAVLSRILFNIPFVLTPHLGGPIGDVQKMKKKLLGEFRLRLLRKYAAGFHVISEEIDNELAAIGISEAQRILVENGVDLARFKPLTFEEKQGLRERMGFENFSHILLFAGRLVPMKRPDLLLKVWPDIHSRYPDAGLIIIGEGPLEEQIISSDFPGLIYQGSQRDVTPYFQAADILLMPSDSEGLPMTLLEAMACGLPVVATSVGGIPEVITDGFTGRLIPVDDPAALTKTIDDLLGNESMRHEIGRAARGVIEEGYGIEKVADKLRELYSGVLVNEGCS